MLCSWAFRDYSTALLPFSSVMAATMHGRICSSLRSVSLASIRLLAICRRRDPQMDTLASVLHPFVLA